MTRDLGRNGCSHPKTFNKFFGTLAAARQAAGERDTQAHDEHQHRVVLARHHFILGDGKTSLSTECIPALYVILANSDGPVAQLGARFHGMEEVVSSNLTRSTKIIKHLSLFLPFFPCPIRARTVTPQCTPPRRRNTCIPKPS